MKKYLHVSQQQKTLDLSALIPSPEALACLSVSNARRLSVLPIARYVDKRIGSDVLLMAVADTSDTSQIERVAKHIAPEHDLTFVSSPLPLLRKAIEECYRERLSLEEMVRIAGAHNSVETETDGMNDFPIEFVNALLRQAVRMRASDIHTSPDSGLLKVRLRIDGVLLDYADITIALHKRLLVRLKIMASLDIAETRYAQDGQFSRIVDGHCVDFRISTFPTVDGENTVLRIIDPDLQLNSLASLAVPDTLLQRLSSMMRQPGGLIVVCGPTGAGKSTTLFALLDEIDKSTLNIMTLEDPVEHYVPGIRQTTIDASRQWGYAQAMRALLRQDPDVLMVGEIRDVESCEMALRAVSTGHQVLTTIHAGCAHSALHRLRELNASGGALALSLTAIAAQRLVRRICHACAGEAGACEVCHGTGYHGRQVIMELLEIKPQIASLLTRGADIEEIRQASAAQGFTSMHDHAKQLVETAVTTSEEISRVLVNNGQDVVSHVPTSAITQGGVHYAVRGT